MRLIATFLCRNRKGNAKSTSGRGPPSTRSATRGLQPGNTYAEPKFYNNAAFVDENIYDTIQYDGITYANDVNNDPNMYGIFKEAAGGVTNSYEIANETRPNLGQKKYAHLETLKKPQARSNDYEMPQTGLNNYANPELRATELYESVEASTPNSRPLAVVNPQFVQPPSASIEADNGLPKPDYLDFKPMQPNPQEFKPMQPNPQEFKPMQPNPQAPSADYNPVPDYQDLPENMPQLQTDIQAQISDKPDIPEYLELVDDKRFEYNYAYM
jgi:hypothetical protein